MLSPQELICIRFALEEFWRSVNVANKGKIGTESYILQLNMVLLYCRAKWIILPFLSPLIRNSVHIKRQHQIGRSYGKRKWMKIFCQRLSIMHSENEWFDRPSLPPHLFQNNLASFVLPCSHPCELPPYNQWPLWPLLSWKSSPFCDLGKLSQRATTSEDYQTRHFFSGFMYEFLRQWRLLKNWGEFCKVPIIWETNKSPSAFDTHVHTM